MIWAMWGTVLFLIAACTAYLDNKITLLTRTIAENLAPTEDELLARLAEMDDATLASVPGRIKGMRRDRG